MLEDVTKNITGIFGFQKVTQEFHQCYSPNGEVSYCSHIVNVTPD